MANYFEITPSIRKLYKDFKTIFVFKFGPKTKKFTPKWQIPLFEKRVLWRVAIISKSDELVTGVPTWDMKEVRRHPVHKNPLAQ